MVSTQAGVVRDPTGLYIRGGRADETGLIVDGVSAKDRKPARACFNARALSIVSRYSARGSESATIAPPTL